MVYITPVFTFVQNNILAVVIAIAATIFLGFLWHGPIFGKQWIALNKITPPKPEEVKFSMMAPGLIISIILSFLQAAVIGRLLEVLAPASIVDALVIVAGLWLPFTGLVIAGIYTWASRPTKLTFLDSFHNLASMWVITTVLFYMM